MAVVERAAGVGRWRGHFTVDREVVIVGEVAVAVWADEVALLLAKGQLEDEAEEAGLGPSGTRKGTPV